MGLMTRQAGALGGSFSTCKKTSQSLFENDSTIAHPLRGRAIPRRGLLKDPGATQLCSASWKQKNGAVRTPQRAGGVSPSSLVGMCRQIRIAFPVLCVGHSGHSGQQIILSILNEIIQSSNLSTNNPPFWPVRSDPLPRQSAVKQPVQYVPCPEPLSVALFPSPHAQRP